MFLPSSNGKCKKIALVAFEDMEMPIWCLINVNPKEYFEYYSDRHVNNKLFGQKKDTLGMDF